MSGVRKSTAIRRFPDKPAATLSFVLDDDINDDDENFTRTIIEKEPRSKTEKSVHFADEYESVSELESSQTSLQTSRDVITWIPSEHLYSEDTFMPETETQKGLASTVPSYGSSTFIDLESEDETRTDSEQSQTHTGSLASSAIFSSGSSTDTSSRREVTEIVKDIDELEESQFATHADSLPVGEEDEKDLETDISECEDEEMAEEARQNFLVNTIRRIRLREVKSPRSLALDSASVSVSSPTSPHMLSKDQHSKERAAFCKKMIEACSKPKAEQPPRRLPDLHKKCADQKKSRPIQLYGLNPAIVERLKMDNLKHAFERRSDMIDKDIEASEKYVRENQHIVEENVKRKFISMRLAQLQKENTEERIQAHLIKMHPVSWFADFVNGLPNPKEDSREILYYYKTQIEARQQQRQGDG